RDALSGGEIRRVSRETSRAAGARNAGGILAIPQARPPGGRVLDQNLQSIARGLQAAVVNERLGRCLSRLDQRPPPPPWRAKTSRASSVRGPPAGRVSSHSAIDTFTRFPIRPLTKDACQEPVTSKSAPDIQPPSALPNTDATTTMLSRVPASCGGKYWRTMMAYIGTMPPWNRPNKAEIT